MQRKRPTFEHACRIYVHRFTMDHVPDWARKPMDGGASAPQLTGRYYAPQYRSDREWYESTVFPGELDHIGRITDCHSRNATWPLGMSLDKPYRVAERNGA